MLETAAASGIVYSGGKAWTQAHGAWLRAQRFDQRALQLAYDSAYETVVPTLERRDRLDAAIAEMAADSLFTPVVDRLCCLRGVSTLTAFGLAVEIGDWHRLGGRSIGAYLGLVPTESSSGGETLAGRVDQDRQRPRPTLNVPTIVSRDVLTLGVLARVGWATVAEVDRQGRVALMFVSPSR